MSVCVNVCVCERESVCICVMTEEKEDERKGRGEGGVKKVGLKNDFKGIKSACVQVFVSVYV